MSGLIKQQGDKTSQQPATAAKPSALNLMASRLSCDPAKLLGTLKATVFKGASDEEVMALVVVSNEYELNPLLKEMYAFPAKGGGIVPIVSVDGWNKMLIRQPSFDGITFEFEEDDKRHPITCTATIHIKGRAHPVKVTEYFDECFRQTDNWKNMPHRMLRNRTLCQASRMAFGFSGVHHPEEADQIVDIDSVTVATAAPAELPPKIVATPPATTPQQELEALVIGAGCTFSHLQQFGTETGNIANADSIAGFDEITRDDANRMLRSKKELVHILTKIKEAK